MKLAVIALVAVVMAALGMSPSHGATANEVVTVTRTDDPVPDACLPEDCSLREAIAAANASESLFTINLPAGIYQLALPGINEDLGLTGDLDITENLIINGAGSSATIIDGGALDRVFHTVTPMPDSPSLLFTGMTIRNGNALGDGGGIRMEGNYGSEFSDVSFISNMATGDGGALWSGGDYPGWFFFGDCLVAGNTGLNGGGIAITLAARLVIERCVFKDNAASSLGGAIELSQYGTIETSGSQLIGNSATSGGAIHSALFGETYFVDSVASGNSATGYGGAFLMDNSALTVERSSINDNEASYGGAIASIQTDKIEMQITDSALGRNLAIEGGALWNTPFRLTNTTIGENRAETNGGAIFGGVGGFDNVTLAGNVADADLDDVGSGGALFGTVAEAHNSIIASNYVAATLGDCTSSQVTTLGYNIIQTVGGCGIAGDVTTDRLGEDAILGQLSDNGGPTETMSLLVGSPAIDGSPLGGSYCATDQRGVGRDSSCDIGAFEFRAGDSDGDGCEDVRETAANPSQGGSRDPLDFWDFYDVTGDQAIDLSDALEILGHFGHGPSDDPSDDLLDRVILDFLKPWRTSAADDGLDLTDALVNLESFGHDCSGPP